VAVTVRQVAVLGFDQHLAVRIDDDAAEGMVAMGEGTAGDRKGQTQKVLVAFVCAVHRSSQSMIRKSVQRFSEKIMLKRLVSVPPCAGRPR
jgi:hypothetical protein